MPEGSSDLITDLSNPNRTILKILNDKYQDPIKAKGTYNKTTKQIEITVTYSKYGINKIMLNDTTDLTLTNTNGIITANTEGISLEDGTYTITVTDNKENTKELKIKVKIPPIIYYGKEVTNYTCTASGVDKWRVFHVDDNIYLIADDYVLYENLPTSTKGTKLNKGKAYCAYFTAILSNYIGSAWIRTNTNAQARNWLTWVNSYPSSTNNNIKAVAYMMDTNKWSGFANSTYAEYAIGGPTLELFCASYKVTHPYRYVECDRTNSYGYQVRWSNGSYVNNITGLTKDDFNSIYIKSDTTKAYGMWLTSPSASDPIYVMFARDFGAVDYANYTYSGLGFRPVVCLKSGVELVDNEDGTCSIQ